jgi:CRP/FNR family nitrogen fixation transcriptional regulator
MPTSLSQSADDGFSAAYAAAAFLSHREAASPLPAGIAPLVAPALNFAPDSEIYAEGDTASSFYKVQSGVVRTCKYLNDGRRQIDAFHVAGEVFGIESGTVHGLSAEAVTACSVTPYRRSNLEKIAGQDDAMALNLFSYAMHCLERTRAHSLLLGRGSATQKLAAFLLDMMHRRPVDEMIQLAMTRQDIADYLGMTIETVSRTLSQLERDGVIVFSSTRRIRLKNLTALQALQAA